MSVRLLKGKTKLMSFPVTASTEFTKDTFVTTSSGKLVPATSSTNAADILGVIRQTIASTDDDYADERDVLIEVPTQKNNEYEIDVTASLAATNVGTYLDLTDAGTVNPAASTNDVVLCVKYLSATKGVFVLNTGL